MFRIAWIMICVVGLSVAPALGCDLCGCYSAREARVTKPGLYVGVFEQFTHFGTLQLDGRETENESGEYLDSSITQVLFGCQFGDRLTVQMNLPLIHRSYSRPVGHSIEQGTEAGLGDLALVSKYRVYSLFQGETVIICNVLGGVKLPSGDSDRLAEELDEGHHGEKIRHEVPSGVHGHDLALGSGSTDGIVGGSVYVHHRRFFGEVAVQYAIRSTGSYDYRYANDLLWTAKPGVYLVMNDNWTLSAEFCASGETKGLDQLDGEELDDTGMTSAFLGPSFTYTRHHALEAMFGADFPVVLHNTAYQIVPDYRIRAAVVWRF